jgi:uncharacterized membrane protein
VLAGIPGQQVGVACHRRDAVGEPLVPAGPAELLAQQIARDAEQPRQWRLRDVGWRVSGNTVAALMREQGLAARRKKKRKATTRPGSGRWRALHQLSAGPLCRGLRGIQACCIRCGLAQVTRWEAMGNTQTMTGVPAPTLYHRWLGWHAPAMRRALTAFFAGLIVTVVLLPFVTWGLALVAGWNVAALTQLLTIWPIIIRADSSLAPLLAAREDATEGAARVLLVGASVASLLGAGYALHLAGRENGAPRVLLIGVAVLTVVLSWTVINTVYTLRYADQSFRSKPDGIAFGTEDDQQHPSYRDFAYVAFTIGMCYQVSDTTLRDPRVRHTVLAHALLSYVFGVVIVAGTVNLISGLFR